MNKHSMWSYGLIAFLLLIGVSYLVIADSNMYVSLNMQGKNIYNISNLTAVNLQGNLSWGNLTHYPTACPAGSAVTTLGDSVTCTAFPTDTNNSASYVPYVGASKNVNIGNFNLTINGTNVFGNGTGLCFGSC